MTLHENGQVLQWKCPKQLWNSKILIYSASYIVYSASLFQIAVMSHIYPCTRRVEIVHSTSRCCVEKKIVQLVFFSIKGLNWDNSVTLPLINSIATLSITPNSNGINLKDKISHSYLNIPHFLTWTLTLKTSICILTFQSWKICNQKWK